MLPDVPCNSAGNRYRSHRTRCQLICAEENLKWLRGGLCPASWRGGKSIGSLDGNVGVVTGAGTGTGKAIAVDLARAGAHVVIADLSEPAGQAAVRAVEAIGGKAVLQRTDVSRREEAKQLIEATVDRF